MVTLEKYALPKTVSYLGTTYYLNTPMSDARNKNNTPLDQIQAELKKQGRKAVLVKVLPQKLRGRLDMYKQPHKPKEWLFTTNIET